jgi:hypothetical protein
MFRLDPLLLYPRWSKVDMLAMSDTDSSTVNLQQCVVCVELTSSGSSDPTKLVEISAKLAD